MDRSRENFIIIIIKIEQNLKEREKKTRIWFWRFLIEKGKANIARGEKCLSWYRLLEESEEIGRANT